MHYRGYSSPPPGNIIVMEDVNSAALVGTANWISLGLCVEYKYIFIPLPNVFFEAQFYNAALSKLIFIYISFAKQFIRKIIQYRVYYTGR